VVGKGGVEGVGMYGVGCWRIGGNGRNKDREVGKGVGGCGGEGGSASAKEFRKNASGGIVGGLVVG